MFFVGHLLPENKEKWYNAPIQVNNAEDRELRNKI
jgi:hypothetical protein